MKKQYSNITRIKLVLAGMLVAGMTSCTSDDDNNITNNTYVTNMGYYHSQTGGYYAYPYNYYVAGYGYYGGSMGWSSSPHRLTVIISRPRYYTPHTTVIVGVTPPAPKVQNIYHYSAHTYSTPARSTPTVRPSSTPSSRPSISPVRSGGFGSTGGGSGGS